MEPINATEFRRLITHPVLRLGHFPEWLLSRKLYPNWNGKPRYTIPEQLEIPEHRYRPAIPELEVI